MATALAYQSQPGTLPRNPPKLRWFSDRQPSARTAPTELADSDRDDDPHGAARPTSRRDHVVARLRVIANYGAGWDGDQAPSLSKEAIEDAINLVANLAMDLPFVVVPEPEGAIELVARGGGTKAILVLEGNKKVSLFLLQPDNEPSHEEFDIPKFIGAGRTLERILKAALA